MPGKPTDPAQHMSKVGESLQLYDAGNVRSMESSFVLSTE